MPSLTFNRGLALLIVVPALVLPYIGGYPLAYLLMALTLVASIANLVQPNRDLVEPAGLMLVGSFALLLAAFTVSSGGKGADIAFAANFAMLAMFVFLRPALARAASPGNVRLVANLALAGVLLAAVVASYQHYVLDFKRAQGFGSNEIKSAMVALLLGFFALMGLRAVPGKARFIYLLGPILAYIVVYFSGSRGPLIGALGLTAIALLLVPKRRILGIAALGAVAVAVLTVVTFNPKILGRGQNIPQIVEELFSGQAVSAGRSATLRYDILQAGVHAFQESPVFGHGWGHKLAAVKPYLVQKFPATEKFFHMHSDLPNFFVSAGSMGILSYLLIILAPLVGCYFSPRDDSFQARVLGVSFLSGGYLVCGALNMTLGFEFLTTFYIVSAAILIGFCRDATPASPLTS